MVNAGFDAGNLEIIDRMRKVPALKALEDDELKELLRLTEIRQFVKGELILREGDYDGMIYYLISGRVKIAKRSKVLMVLQRGGDVFGEMGIFEGKASSASVYAVDDVTCLALDISDINRYKAESRFAVRYLIFREFAEVLAARLRDATEQLAETRKKLERLEIAYRLAVKDKDLSGLKGDAPGP